MLHLSLYIVGEIVSLNIQGALPVDQETNSSDVVRHVLRFTLNSRFGLWHSAVHWRFILIKSKSGVLT